MELGKCKSLIQSSVVENPEIRKKDFSDQLNNFWGDNKKECFENFGSAKEIESFVNSIEIRGIHGAAGEDGQTSESSTSGEGRLRNQEQKKSESATGETTKENMEGKVEQSDNQLLPFGWSEVTYRGKRTLLVGVSIILIILLWKILKYLFAFGYDVFNSKRLSFIRVTMPRLDTQADREQEKEIAKDMKEKIGRMAQAFRNMWKLGELSVWDNIMTWVFAKPKMSIMLHYENGLVNFIIGVYPEYKNIIESSISAQYPSAAIETIHRPNIFQKKYSEIVPLQPVKDPVYPIRIFSNLEDDPMNNLLDAMGKVPSEDTFTVQIVIKPQGGDYNDKAQKYSNALFKKDESVTVDTPFRYYLLMPWKFFEFLINGPSQKLVEKYSNPYTKHGGDPLIRMVKAEEDAINTMGEEAGKHAFHSGVLVVTSSDNKKRLGENIHNLVSAFSIYRCDYNNALDQPEFVADLLGWLVKPLWRFASLFHLPPFFFRKNIFTVNELASMFHFPDGLFNQAPVIKRLDYKVINAPDNLPVLEEDNGYRLTGITAEEYKGGKIPEIFRGVNHWAIGEKHIKDKNGNQNKLPAIKCFKDGIFLGLNVYRSKFTPVYIRRKDRTRHHYIIGKSGGGKSAFISSMARQDIWNGDGVCVIDPHGDLVEDVLNYIPKERAKDVIIFDAGDEERPLGLNLYEIDKRKEADRVVNDATEIFMKMFGPEIFGPRIQEYFKYASLTLLEDMDEGGTIIDVPRIFTDEAFREYKISKVRNPVVKNFWEKTYNAMGDREKQEIIPYFTSKFVSFITNSLIRNIIGQTKSGFRFRDVMDNGKILLVNLSKGKVGELNAKLLGMILVSQLNNAAMSRADIPEDQRRDFFLYVDEFQNFVTDTFADILSEARKYRLSLIMAHQYIGQLEGGDGNNLGEKESSVKDAVFGNVGTMQSFKVGAPDAEVLEKEYSPVLSQQDIINISNFKVYIKLNINNATTRVFSMNTIFSEDYKNEKVAGILREYSAKKYGRKKEFVDAEITARLGMLNEEEEEQLQMQQEEA